MAGAILIILILLEIFNARNHTHFAKRIFKHNPTAPFMSRMERYRFPLAARLSRSIRKELNLFEKQITAILSHDPDTR